MALALVELLRAGRLTADIVRTFANIALAGLLAIVAGFALGLVLHGARRVRRALEPLLASYYAVPFFVLYPLLIVVFGLNDRPIVAIGFLFGVVAMVLATLNGLDRIPAVLLKVGRVHRLGALRAALLIKLPAAAPQLFTGLKLAVAYAVIGVIAAEFILSGGGLGYAIAYAYNNFDNRTMYALMLLVLAAVVAVNAALHGWEQRVHRRRGMR
jgi:NitT/TauT family transport system permease protein